MNFQKLLSRLKIIDGNASGGARVATDSAGNNRLYINPNVPGGIDVNPTPPVDAIHLKADLANGGSRDMNVNGGAGNVVFSVGPPPGEIWRMWTLGIYIEDNGTLDPGDFGDITNGLGNGLLYEQLIDGVPFELSNFQNNIDLSFYFGSGQTLGQSQGWLNSNKLFIGSRVLDPAVKLTGDNGDLVRATVRDNLTGLDGLQSSFIYWQETT